MAYQIKIQNQHEFLNDVASLYETTSRVFMEYIDNSFDSAADLKKEEESKRGKYKYPYPIKLTITIDPKLKTVKFLDNCSGMNRLKLRDLVENINKSEKKARPWTNGKFGYGAQAFRACCELMVVVSKEKNKLPYKIEIPRHSAMVLEEVQLSNRDFPFESGTLVILKEFDKESWPELSPEILKQEVEKHFEGVLREEDITVKLIWGQSEEVCKPFDYDSILGEKFEREIDELVSPSYSDRAGPSRRKLKYPIKIYLKITEDIISNKRPIFLNKGRRIADVQDINSYRNKSKYRTSLWGHNNLIGFVEINDNLDPVLTRNDFKRDRVRGAFYEFLLVLEDELWKELLEVNKVIEETSFSKLENVLSSLLEKLATQDRMKFREEYVIGGELDFQETENGSVTIKKPTIVEIEDTSDDGEQIPKGEGIEVAGEISWEESSIKVKRQSKSGFRVRFNSIEPPIKGEKQLRSQYVTNDAIHIYTKHQDFQERVDRNRQRELRLSPRLASYIASELSIWYKKLFYEKYKLEPVIKEITGDVENTLLDQVEFVYNLEKLLQQYVYKSLSTLEPDEQ